MSRRFCTRPDTRLTPDLHLTYSRILPECTFQVGTRHRAYALLGFGLGSGPFGLAWIGPFGLVEHHD